MSGLSYRGYAVAAALLFSTGGVAIKGVDLSALSIAGLRSAIAALTFLVLWRMWPRFFSFRIGHPMGYLAIGAYFCTLTLFVAGNKFTTAANTILLQYTAVAWVLVGGAIFLRERITWDRVLAVLGCLVGMILMLGEDVEFEAMLGNLMAASCGFTFAVMILLMRALRDDGAIAVVFWGNVSIAAVFLPWAVLMEPGIFAELAQPLPLFSMLWLGSFQITVAYCFYMAALKGLPAIELALILLLEPLMNPLWVYMLQGEQPSMMALVGGSIIMAALLLRTLSQRAQEERVDAG